MQIRMHRKKSLYLCSIGLVISGLLTGCIGNDTTFIDDNDFSLVIGTMSNESIYPFGFTNDNTLLIFPNIFDGLVEFNEVFGIIPGLAESWTNPDDVTWRFNLRKGVVFHDGSEFAADDVKYCFDTTHAYSKPFVKKVDIVNNYTIDFITHEPYPGLLQSLAHNFLIYSRDYAETHNDSRPVGTGPYQLLEYVEANYTTLERFDQFWAEIPSIKMVTLKVIPDKEDRIKALQSGEIDIAEYNVDNKVDEISGYDGINIMVYPPLSTYILGFDLRQNMSYSYEDGENPTADVRVRKALYHAIDIDALIEGPFHGLAVPASQLLTPYIFGYNPQIKRLEYNLSLSKQYLDEAGYEDGFDIVLDCITIGYEYNLENCNLIVDQLAEIGVNVTLNTLSVSEFNQKVVYEKNSSLYLVGWGTVSVDGGYIYNRFIMTEGENYTGFLNTGHYSNPEVDLLGIEAATEMNPRKRLELLQEGFHIALVEDVILVPLFSQNLFYFSSDRVELEPRADLRLLFEDISITTAD